MTFFETVTESPEALGAFLASLSAVNTPWEGYFQTTVCPNCERYGQDCGDVCPHQAERDNPTWWLVQGGKPGEVLGLAIRIKAAFPIEWGREYYTVAEKKKERRAPCICCDNTGKVTIKGIKYDCPRCKGNWREKEVVGETTVYSVAKWMLKSVSATSRTSATLRFEQINSTERYAGSMEVWARDFRDMVSTAAYGKQVKVYDDYKAAMAEVKRLNAAEREKEKEASADG